jgi:hypothetical protein
MCFVPVWWTAQLNVAGRVVRGAWLGILFDGIRLFEERVVTELEDVMRRRP